MKYNVYNNLHLPTLSIGITQKLHRIALLCSPSDYQSKGQIYKKTDSQRFEQQTRK